MLIILEDEYTVDYGKNYTGFGTPEYIVKIQNANRTILEDLKTHPEEAIKELLKAGTKKGPSTEVKTPTGRIRIKQAPWKYRKRLEKYGLEFRPNHYRRTYTYIDNLQRIDLQGRYIHVWDGLGTVRVLLPQTIKKIDASLPVWWRTLPHHHISQYHYTDYRTFSTKTPTLDGDIIRNVQTHAIVSTPVKTYRPKFTIEVDTVHHFEVPFIEGVYNVTLPLKEIVYLDTTMSIRDLPPSAGVEKVAEPPLKWTLKDNTETILLSGYLIYERRGRHRIKAVVDLNNGVVSYFIDNRKVDEKTFYSILYLAEEGEDIDEFLDVL